jgi:hemolysin-activating ACP:hemolysin acyltransferase
LKLFSQAAAAAAAPEESCGLQFSLFTNLLKQQIFFISWALPSQTQQSLQLMIKSAKWFLRPQLHNKGWEVWLIMIPPVEKQRADTESENMIHDLVVGCR